MTTTEKYVGQALDREDVGTIGLHREHRAALHRLAVDMHGARPARRCVATDVCAGETEVLTQVLDQQ